MAMTPEEKRAAQAEAQRRYRERRKATAVELTPEQIEARRAYMREYMNERNAAMTPEEREEFNAAKREYEVARRVERSQEQIERDRTRSREQARQRRASLAPEQRKEEYLRWSDKRRQKDDYPEYRAARLATTKRFSAALRMTALIRYSSDPPHCVCCGDTHIEFLAIDHIGGGGNAHRKELKGASINLWLRNNGYPDGFRVLCHNCNFAVRLGPCPHEREKIIPLTRPQGGCS